MDDEAKEHERQMIPSMHSIRGTREWVIKEHVRKTSEGSLTAVERLKCKLDVSYGDSRNECVDIFYPASDNHGAPVFVFIHGGYWVDMSRQLSRCMAHSFTRAGCLSVIVGYDQAPKVDLATIVRQTTKAIGFVLKMAENSGSRGVFICGHSAGAHLATMSLSTNWTETYGDSVRLLKGLILLSGVFDVRLIVNTENNEHLNLNREEAWQLSPLRVAGQLAKQCTDHKCPVMTVVGGYESKTFIKMSRDYDQALMECGLEMKFSIQQDVDHFDLMENLMGNEYTLTKDILSFMDIQDV